MSTSVELGRIASSATQQREYWDSPTNFRLAGECVPFDYQPPALADMVDQVRRDPDARIRHSSPEVADETYASAFRSISIEQAMAEPFSLAHFKLTHFAGRGQLLFGFWDGVMKK